MSCCKTPLLIEESIMTKCFEENKPTGPPPAGPPPAGGPGAGGPGGPGGPMCVSYNKIIYILRSLYSLNSFPSKCVGQCALTAIGIFNNNKIDKEAAVKYLTTRANGDATVLSVWTTALDTCVAKAASKEAEFAQLLSQAPQGGKACNPSSGFVMACMFQNTITVS